MQALRATQLAPGALTFVALLATQIVTTYVYPFAAPTGTFLFSPSLIIALIYAVQLIVSIALHVRQASQASQTSFSLHHGWIQLTQQVNSKLFTQLGSLSFIYTLSQFMTFASFVMAPASTVLLFQSSSTFFAALLSKIYLGDSFVTHQWLSLVLQACGLLATQWDACLQTALAPVFVYTLLLLNTLLGQFALLWHVAIAKHSGATAHVQTIIVAGVGAPLALWAFWFLPDTVFSASTLPHSVASFSWRIAVLVAVGAAHALGGRVLRLVSSRQISASLSVASLVVLALDHALRLAYVTATVAVGACTVCVATLMFYMLAEEGKPAPAVPSYKPISAPASNPVMHFVLLAIPDFVIAKYRRLHVLVLGVFVCVLVLIFALSGFVAPNGISPDESRLHLAPDVLTPPLDLRSVSPSSAVLSYPSHGTFWTWSTQLGDEAIEVGEVEQIFWRRRNPDIAAKSKDVAVCLAGAIRPGFAQDLEWLYSLFHSVGSYDMFQWLAPTSIPYASRALKPLDISYQSSPVTPIGMARRWRNRKNDNDEWATHLWGMAHCIQLVDRHTNLTGVHYEWLMIAQPNTTFLRHPLPPMAEWEAEKMHFWPQTYLMEQLVWGGYNQTRALMRQLHPNLLSWDGSKLSRDYVRNMAKHLNMSVRVHEPPATQIQIANFAGS